VTKVLKVTSAGGTIGGAAVVYDAEEFLEGLFRPEAAPPGVPTVGPDDLPPDWRLFWEERAAVREYDGGLPREHAEAAALADTLGEMRRHGIDP
jgi:hypothetical protein